ncbi:channel-forming protein ArfA/OmpATb [[Mycobacterium] nativiensis]|uniref:Peptidoglycan-binding protein ArfA BON-like domain-containing protein n=1 Tax=[Mycobacterium] nativiensis TaxID=2855503 RepID=A0ABU5Y3H1_9MYCO|nr:hypothetical protein [Mycolicibacter sp. MYC340]MEB3034693.1 hypothetical protein [Mycolicibacter sp. MYC340]
MRAGLIGAALVAVLLGAIGCSPAQEPVVPAAVAVAAEPLTVIRHGNQFMLTGDVPDPAARRALLDAVITSAEDVTVVDGLRLAPGATTPDLSAAAPVFEAAAVIGDFTLRAAGDTVTLGGTAARAAEAAAVADTAEQAWPRAHIVNELVTNTPGRE